MNVPERFIAIDWSGNASPSGQKRHIWIAELSSACAMLFHQLTRDEVCDWLIDETKRDSAPTVIGIDFAFSFPSSFLNYRRYESVDELWGMGLNEGEEWLSSCQPPFWGRPKKRRPVTNPEAGFRKTDSEVRVNGISPKSPYQIGGAGAVGTGSIRGFPILARLRKSGFSIWPFHSVRSPLVVEIYPRLLTGPVTKSNKPERINYLRRPEFSGLPEVVRRNAEESEDAFDALVSAVRMREHGESFSKLKQTSDSVESIEGLIWKP